MNAKLNKRERRAQQLLAHYETCERLAIYLVTGRPDFHRSKPFPVDGKKISVGLFKIEQTAHNIATAYCNGDARPYHLGGVTGRFDPNSETGWEAFVGLCQLAVGDVLGKLPPGFFVNGDARGYALKIDNDNPEGKALIDAVKLHTDWGGYGILSPEITGD